MMHCPSCRPRHCWASLGTLSSQTISLTLSQPSTLFFLVGAYKQYIYLRWCTNQILQSLLTHMPPHKCPLPCLRGCEQWGERIEGMLCHKRVSDGHIGVGEARWNSKKVSGLYNGPAYITVTSTHCHWVSALFCTHCCKYILKVLFCTNCCKYILKALFCTNCCKYTNKLGMFLCWISFRLL